MTEDAEFEWVRWQDTAPAASCIPVEVACEGWDHIRVWHPSASPSEDVPGLVWRPCSKDILHLALQGGVYGPDGEALYGSPPLIVHTADPNGPWSTMFVIRPAQWPDCGLPARLWLVPCCGELDEVPPDLLANLVAVADGGEPIVMWGRDVEQLRKLAAQVVGMSGGFRA